MQVNPMGNASIVRNITNKPALREGVIQRNIPKEIEDLENFKEFSVNARNEIAIKLEEDFNNLKACLLPYEFDASKINEYIKCCQTEQVIIIDKSNLSKKLEKLFKAVGAKQPSYGRGWWLGNDALELKGTRSQFKTSIENQTIDGKLQLAALDIFDSAEVRSDKYSKSNLPSKVVDELKHKFGANILPNTLLADCIESLKWQEILDRRIDSINLQLQELQSAVSSSKKFLNQLYDQKLQELY